jgi:membrane-bound lytic murein transglycosylase B
MARAPLPILALLGALATAATPAGATRAQSAARGQAETPAQAEAPAQTEAPAQAETPTQGEAPAQAEAPAIERTLPGRSRFDLSRPDIAAFVEHMVTLGLEREAVYATLAKAEPQPKIIEAMSRPAEKSLAWWEYRARFLNRERVDAGARLWREHRELLDAIAIERHVEPEYVLGIIGVETYFGRLQGRYRVLDALATLGFDYPARGEYFRRELGQFLLLTRDGEIDPQTALGSYAGAMGAAQFMPSSFQKFAVDEDGRGRPDLWTDWADIFGSVANYLQQHGWEYGQPVLAEAGLGTAPAPTLPATLTLDSTLGALRERGMSVNSTVDAATACVAIPAALKDSVTYRVGFRNFYVITRYNRSPMYAMAVHDLAQAIAARVLAPDAP